MKKKGPWKHLHFSVTSPRALKKIALLVWLAAANPMMRVLLVLLPTARSFWLPAAGGSPRCVRMGVDQPPLVDKGVVTPSACSREDGFDRLPSLAADQAPEATLRTPADRLSGTDRPTVWSEFGQLAASTGAVNLGQGFPDWQPPAFVVEQAQVALAEGFHQYTRPAGHPPLVEVLAERYSGHLGRHVDAMTEVATTVGASQALYLTLQAHVNPGDEVVLLEPAFDLYYGQVRLAGGKVVPVPLAVDDEAGRWRLDLAALERACTSQTKLLVLNSPHNPTGTAFTAEEMEAIAAVVRAHPNLLVISDEVYKYTVYAEGAAHTHFAALPGMFERTVTLSSAGKTFSITGWQAGWCVGPERLIRPIQLLLPFVQFCVSTPVQNALSRVLTLADGPYEGHASYYEWLRAMYRHKREVLATGLRRAGMGVMAGQGGFFLMADTSAIAVPQRYLDEATPAAPDGVTRDWAFCRWLALEGGVIAIPSSPFYSGPNKALASNYIRFAFCKSDDTLVEACERIEKLIRSSADS
ncbi:aminotransferase class I/II-fold pyridoxal phosphate-dependent enzyme [bacterium]|nr:aminotransferase class I/II-fold pyridoxal phosphate-dependent enzyme [bacterium]